MEITLEKKDPVNATIKVNLKEEDYQPKVVEKVKEYSKKANLKGFRPGKVPVSVIEKMYGKSILVDEVNNLLSQSVINYIKEQKLPIIGDPLPDTEKADLIDWETQKEFEFKYQIGLIPDFSYELSSKLRFSKYIIDADDKAVSETLENLRSQYGKMSNPDSSLEGDFIYGELKEAEGDFTTNTLVPTSKIKKSEVKNFIGVKPDDQIEFDIRKAFEDSAAIAHVTGLSKEEAEGKKGKFILKVSKINRSEPAPLDQDFFDKIFGKDAVKSEEEFKEKLKSTIEENYTREGENLLNKEIREKLVDATKIDLPDEFLKRWLFVSNEGKVSREDIEKEYDYYLKELKWNLIKNRIAEDNGIKVENEEVISKTKEMILQQFGGMSLGEEMEETMNKIADNYLKQEKGKNYMKIYDQVFVEKTIQLIMEKVSIEEKKVGVEEFKKKFDA